MIKKILTAICLFTTVLVHAQTGNRGINLEQVLSLGALNNQTVQQTEAEVDLANARLSQARSWWVPQLTAGMNSHILDGAALNANGRFYLDIRQKTLWTGIGATADWDLQKGILGNQVASLGNAAARLRSQADRNEILLTIINNYYDVLAAQLTWQAWEQLAIKSDSIARQTEAYAESGLVAVSSSLIAKSNALRLHSEALKHKASWQQKSGELSALLDLPPGTNLVATDTLLPLVTISDELMATEIDYTAQINEAHPRILSEEKTLEMKQKGLTAANWGWLWPHFTVQAYSARFGGLFEEVRPVDEVTFPDPKKSYDTKVLNAGISWSLPLANLTHGGERKEAQALQRMARLELEKQKSSIGNRFAADRNNLLNGKKRIELAQSSVALAENALQQSLARQQSGTLEPLETIQALELTVKARLELIAAVCDYNKLQYELWVVAGRSL
ncbi:MAG: TolC family protein [Bacteroidetes bacterium]|nr:MAG: TolC family protein [Bacteroidota bacterium]